MIPLVLLLGLFTIGIFVLAFKTLGVAMHEPEKLERRPLYFATAFAMAFGFLGAFALLHALTLI